MNRQLIAIALLLFSCTRVFSQSSGKFHIRELNTDIGLPSNGIKGLQWDEESGFLWIATEAGVVRFNGLDFKTFNDTVPLASERMLFIVRNHAGNIIAVDQSKNLFTVKKNQLIFVSKTDTEPVTNTRRLFTLTISDSLFSKGHLPANPYAIQFNRIAPVSDTAAYILHRNGLNYYSTNTDRFIEMNGSPHHPLGLFKVENECFVVNTDYKIFRLGINKPQLTEVPLLLEGSSEINPIKDYQIYWHTGMKNGIMAKGSKVWLLSFDGKAVIAKFISDEVPGNIFYRYVQYSEKNNLLFIGTDSRGVIVIQRKRVEVLKNNNTSGNERNAYYVQLELANQNVLTGEGHILGKSSSPNPAIPIRGKFGNSILMASDSVLWYHQFSPLTGKDRLYSYDFRTRTTKFYDKTNTESFATMGETEGQVYIADIFGIGKISGDSVQYIYRSPNGTIASQVFTMPEVKPGVLAVATCQGLFFLNVRDKKIDTVASTKDLCVRAAWKYKDYLFLGTYGRGIFIYRNGVLKPIPLDVNNYLLYAHCFVPDEMGYVWMSTNRGLFKASISEMVNAFDHSATQVYYHYFGKNDGMLMTEMNGGCEPCALRLKNGIISFPTMDGLLQVDPLLAKPVLPDGDIFIDEVWTDNNKINPDSLGYTFLPADTKGITFLLGVSAWCNKENLYLSYQLDNDTLGWTRIYTENGTLVRLNNLSPGTHFLRIKKLNGFGIKNISYVHIRFTIQKSWYGQWWFFALMAATIVALFFLFSRLRTRRLEINQQRLESQVTEKTKELQQKNEVLEKNDRIKTRLISIISHDIITPLKFLTAAGKNLQEKKRIMPEELQDETIREMTNTSQELQLLSTNILNWIKYQNENRLLAKENFNMADIVNQVISVLNSLAKKKNLTLRNEVDKDLVIYQYFEPLKILIYNLISNSINFSERGEIVISAQPTGEALTISVKDEGVGMTAHQINNILADQFIISSANMDNKKGNGLGFLIIKDLMKMMDATLDIQSAKGSGTMVSIRLPIVKNN